jgi:hypothetical protein
LRGVIPVTGTIVARATVLAGASRAAFVLMSGLAVFARSQTAVSSIVAASAAATATGTVVTTVVITALRGRCGSLSLLLRLFVT